MVRLGLLLAGSHVVERAGFESQHLSLFAGKLFYIILITCVIQRKPVDLVAGIVDTAERFQFGIDRIKHIHAVEAEMQRFAGYRTDKVAYMVYICMAYEDGGLVHRKLGTGGILAPAAVICQKADKVFGACTHTQKDGTVHYGHIFGNVRHMLDGIAHRKPYFDDITLLPLAVQRDV